MRFCMGKPCSLSPRPEDPPQCCARHRLAASSTLQHDEDPVRRAPSRTLERQVAMEQIDEQGRQRDRALLVPLADDADALVLEVQVHKAQAKHLAAAEAAQQHRVGDTEVAVALQAREELVHLLDRERLDDLPRFLHSKLPGRRAAQYLEPEVPVPAEGTKVAVPLDTAGQLAAVDESIEEPERVKPAIDALRLARTPTLPGEELVQILRRHLGEREVGRREPAMDEHEVVRVRLDSAGGEAADAQALEEPAALDDLRPVFIDDGDLPELPLDARTRHRRGASRASGRLFPAVRRSR